MELASKFESFLCFSRLPTSKNEHFLLSCSESLDFLHQIWHVGSPHACYRLTKKNAGTFICHGVSRGKPSFHTAFTGPSQALHRLVTDLLTTILGVFAPNLGVRMTPSLLPFAKIWCKRADSSRSYTRNNVHFFIIFRYHRPS